MFVPYCSYFCSNFPLYFPDAKKYEVVDLLTFKNIFFSFIGTHEAPGSFATGTIVKTYTTGTNLKNLFYIAIFIYDFSALCHKTTQQVEIFLKNLLFVGMSIHDFIVSNHKTNTKG
jgi:hypothetical protein